jgi:hypothetical protein
VHHGPVRHYTIPVGPGEEPIVVPSNDLPADSDDLADALTTVQANLSCWMDFLSEYYRQGKLVEFEKLLRKALNTRE